MYNFKIGDIITCEYWDKCWPGLKCEILKIDNYIIFGKYEWNNKIQEGRWDTTANYGKWRLVKPKNITHLPDFL